MGNCPHCGACLISASAALSDTGKGLRLTFNGKPSDSVRAKLKENGFKWHGSGRYWYSWDSLENRAVASSIGADCSKLPPVLPREAKPSKGAAAEAEKASLAPGAWAKQVSMLATQSADHRAIVSLEGRDVADSRDDFLAGARAIFEGQGGRHAV